MSTTCYYHKSKLIEIGADITPNLNSYYTNNVFVYYLSSLLFNRRPKLKNIIISFPKFGPIFVASCCSMSFTRKFSFGYLEFDDKIKQILLLKNRQPNLHHSINDKFLLKSIRFLNSVCTRTLFS